MEHIPSPHPALRPHTQTDHQRDISVYTDGSCLNNGRLDARSGAGVWFANNHPLNKSIRVPGPEQSNQTGELAAILTAVQAVALTTNLTIVTDSQYAIKTLTNSLPDMEDAGWVNVPNAWWIQAAVYHLRRRSTPTHFKWVKGHRGTIGNEEADKLAAAGVNKPEEDEVDLTIPDHFKVSGLCLISTMQAVAYVFISSWDRPPMPRQVENMLERTRSDLEATIGYSISNRNIWKGCQNVDIRRPVQAFLYKAINCALRIGEFWSNILTFKHHTCCSSCDHTIKSLEHILLECRNPTTALVWSLTSQFWPSSTGQWPELTLGMLLGCRSVTLPPLEGRPRNKGPSRLIRILLLESMHLIWVLRCERVIQEAQHSLVMDKGQPRGVNAPIPVTC